MHLHIIYEWSFILGTLFPKKYTPVSSFSSLSIISFFSVNNAYSFSITFYIGLPMCVTHCFPSLFLLTIVFMTLKWVRKSSQKKYPCPVLSKCCDGSFGKKGPCLCVSIITSYPSTSVSESDFSHCMFSTVTKFTMYQHDDRDVPCHLFPICLFPCPYDGWYLYLEKSTSSHMARVTAQVSIKDFIICLYSEVYAQCLDGSSTPFR